MTKTVGGRMEMNVRDLGLKEMILELTKSVEKLANEVEGSSMSVEKNHARRMGIGCN